MIDSLLVASANRYRAAAYKNYRFARLRPLNQRQSPSTCFQLRSVRPALLRNKISV